MCQHLIISTSSLCLFLFLKNTETHPKVTTEVEVKEVFLKSSFHLLHSYSTDNIMDSLRNGNNESVYHLKEGICKFHSNAVPGPAAKGTEEVLLACIPVNVNT